MKKITCGVVVAFMLILGSALSALAAGRGHHGGHHGFSRHHFGGHGFSGHHFRRHHHFGHHPHFRHHFGHHPHFRHHHFGQHHFRHHHLAIPPVWPYWYGLTYHSGPIVVDPYVYVQPEPTLSTQQPAQHYWYYCESAKAYYPYVPRCPGGWIRVTPWAPSQSQ
jgi:hypothetical protein